MREAFDVSDETGKNPGPAPDSGGSSELSENPVLSPLFSTEPCAKPPQIVDNSTSDLTADAEDPALAALRNASRPFQRGTAQGRRTRFENLRGRGKGRRREESGARGGYSGASPDDTDPQRIGDLVNGYVSDRGWQRPLSEARVFADWPTLVGSDIASHSTPSSLQDGVLKVSAESTAWATQLQLMSGTILARLVAELGPQVVRSLVFTGPKAPSWKHGQWSVRGARGPRDTYG
jgi:predicted nucleic acid-binding Zn ribbon protein